jgi:superfamily II DNA or RNA helicase
MWMCKRERSQPRGGILADESGMGKNVQTVAMILRNQPVTVPEDDGQRAALRTLIVTPSKAVMEQWKANLCIHSKLPNLDIFVLGEKDDALSPLFLADQDIVLTTYKTLDKLSRCAAFKVLWYRVILDRADILELADHYNNNLQQLKYSRKWLLVSDMPTVPSKTFYMLQQLQLAQPAALTAAVARAGPGNTLLVHK